MRIAAQKRAGARSELVLLVRGDLIQVEKVAREAQIKADAVDASVYALKAVSPHARVKRDARKPAEIIDAIAEHGRVVDQALSDLRAMLTAIV